MAAQRLYRRGRARLRLWPSPFDTLSERRRDGLSLHAIPQPSLSGRAAAVSKGPREAPSLAFPLRYALRATQGGFILAFREGKGRSIAACHPPTLPEWPRSGCIEGAARSSVSGLPPSIRSSSYSGRVYRRMPSPNPP